MTRFILRILLFVAVIGTSLHGQTLVSVTNLPTNNFFGNGITGAYGLTVTGPAADSGLWISSIWSSSPNWNYHLYKVSTAGAPSDSMLLRSDFPGNYLLGSYGLTYDGENFWYAKQRSSLATCEFFKISRGGTILDSMSIPWQYVGGICWADSGLWFSIYYPNPNAILFKLDVTTHTIVDSIHTYGTQPQGIAFDGAYYYYVMDDNDGNDERIYAYDPVAGDTVYSIALPERSSGVSPRGMVWDGHFLWLVARPVTGNVFALYKYDLSGSGTPQITVGTLSYDFHDVKIGYPATFNLQINSTGTADLRIDSIRFSNATFGYQLATPDTLPAGQFITVPVSFDPNMYGPQIDTLRVYSNDPNKPVVRVALKGRGIWSLQEIDLSATVYDFGPVLRDPPLESMNTWDLDITNQGAQPLTVTGMSFTDPDFYLLNAPSFPLMIDSVAARRVRVVFRPARIGAYQDTMTIASNDSSEALRLVLLYGTAFDSSYDYGNVFWTFMTPDNPGTSFQDYSVEAIRAMPDVTGDGYDDVLTGTENYWLLCLNGNATGTTDTLWSFNTGLDDNNTGSLGTNGDDAQKALQVVGDLNNDGHPDVVAGYGGGNEGVYALNGLTGEVLWSFNDPINYNLGDINAVYAREDFNGDSVNDILATGSATDETGGSGRRTVYCFNGVNGSILWQYFTGAFTRGVVTLGDVNDNGKPDVVTTTGDPHNSVIGIDGQSGSFLWEFPVAAGIYGAKELVRYDIPDSTSDVIVAGSTQYIYRLDGRTGGMIWSYNVGALNFVNQVILLDDVNANGWKDIIAPITGTSLITCLDGLTGLPIWSNTLGSQTFGAARIPDINGDGINDAVYVAHDNKVYLINGVTGQIIDNSYAFGTGGNNDAAESVDVMNDVDGNGSFEILAGSRNGMVAAVSGGTALTSVARPHATSHRFELTPNYPNPFNPSTTIRFQLPASSDVTVSIYNVLGQVVRVLMRSPAAAGLHTVVWDGKDNAGRPCASGVYIYRLEAGPWSGSRKMLLIK